MIGKKAQPHIYHIGGKVLFDTTNKISSDYEGVFNCNIAIYGRKLSFKKNDATKEDESARDNES